MWGQDRDGALPITRSASQVNVTVECVECSVADEWFRGSGAATD